MSKISGREVLVQREQDGEVEADLRRKLEQVNKKILGARK